MYRNLNCSKNKDASYFVSTMLNPVGFFSSHGNTAHAVCLSASNRANLTLASLLSHRLSLSCTKTASPRGPQPHVEVLSHLSHIRRPYVEGDIVLNTYCCCQDSCYIEFLQTIGKLHPGAILLLFAFLSAPSKPTNLTCIFVLQRHTATNEQLWVSIVVSRIALFNSVPSLYKGAR